MTLGSLLEGLKVLIVALFGPLFKVLGYLVYFVFDGILFSFYMFLETLDLSALAFDWAARWAGLPPQLIYLVHAVGLPQCLAVISTAIGIRFALNWIPSALTRV